MKNLKYRVLKKGSYRGHTVYCRQLGKDLYEYALIFNNEIYAAPFLMPRKTLKALWLVMSGKIKSWEEYLKREQQAIIQTLGKTAEITIDTLLKKDEK